MLLYLYTHGKIRRNTTFHRPKRKTGFLLFLRSIGTTRRGDTTSTTQTQLFTARLLFCHWRRRGRGRRRRRHRRRGRPGGMARGRRGGRRRRRRRRKGRRRRRE
jgi:hypothetical protein